MGRIMTVALMIGIMWSASWHWADAGELCTIDNSYYDGRTVEVSVPSDVWGNAAYDDQTMMVWTETSCDEVRTWLEENERQTSE